METLFFLINYPDENNLHVFIPLSALAKKKNPNPWAVREKSYINKDFFFFLL